jgi:integrase
MVLQMARPFKHPTTGVYYYRRRVPKHLLAAIGRSIEKRSLGTKDPCEARIRFAAVNAEIELSWAAMAEAVARRSAPPELRKLSHKEIHAIAGEVYRNVVDRHEDNPADAETWRRALVSDEWMKPPQERRPGTPPIPRQIIFGHQSHGPRRASDFIAPILQRLGVKPDSESGRILVRATATALERAHSRLERAAEGDFSPDPFADRLPPPVAATATPTPLFFSDIKKRWREEADFGQATEKRWFPVIEKFLVHARVADLRAITEDHARNWIAELRRQGLSPNTIIKVYLAATKALFNWACQEKLLKANPFAEIKVRAARTVSLRERALTMQEARTVLLAAFAEPDLRTTEFTAAARRWVPWLLAYTGARVNEITQLRCEDVRYQATPDGQQVLVINITPEAGRVKRNEARLVAIHPHLLEQGFLDFVRDLDRPRLFYDESAPRRGTATRQAEIVGADIAAWIRSLGVSDRNVDPNHGFRHGLSSLLMEAEVQERIIRGIMGHGARSAAERYGFVWPSVMLASLSKITIYRRLVA